MSFVIKKDEYERIKTLIEECYSNSEKIKRESREIQDINEKNYKINEAIYYQNLGLKYQNELILEMQGKLEKWVSSVSKHITEINAPKNNGNINFP